MGNRGQIEIIYAHPDPDAFEEGGSNWLYSHWTGCFVAEYVRVALRSLPRDRWRDPECIERRLSVEIPPGRYLNPFNLERVPPRVYVQHRNVVVDPWSQTVSFVAPTEPGDISATYTFEAFVTAPAVEMDRAFHRGFGRSTTKEGRKELAKCLEHLQKCWPPQPEWCHPNQEAALTRPPAASRAQIVQALPARRARSRRPQRR